jgi:hypothetical protein
MWEVLILTITNNDHDYREDFGDSMDYSFTAIDANIMIIPSFQSSESINRPANPPKGTTSEVHPPSG